MAAARVSLSWLGVRKTLTPEQKSQAADTFDAGWRSCISAAKKPCSTRRIQAFKAADRQSAALQILSLLAFRQLLPYPDPGVRLIRQDDIGTFNVQMTTLQADLVHGCRKGA